jgi:perosamine synthetase
MIRQYEEAFAKTVSAPHAYSFWKGRAALYAILLALDIEPGDEVILPGFTCVVVPNAVLYTGATPVFADICPNTYNLDPRSVEKVISSKSRALIVQHTFGIPAEMNSLLEIAKSRGLTIIEDCAHAVGSTYELRKVGSFGRAAFFSSQWSKPYTTGLGGVAVTSDPNLAARLRELQRQFTEPSSTQVAKLWAQFHVYERLFGPRMYWTAVSTLRRMSEWKLFVGSSGNGELNSEMPPDASWRMSGFQAQVGLKRLSNLDRNLAHRRRLAEFYEQSLRARGWSAPITSENTNSVYVRYPLRAANKREVLSKAKAARLEMGSWFESVLHPISHSLERFGYRAGSCPEAERAARETLNLPLHGGVSMAEAERIVEFVSNIGNRP